MAEIKLLNDDEIVEEKTKYTRKLYTPIYEPKGDKPLLSDLYDTTKRDELTSDIENDNELDIDMKNFLKSAAERHTAFDFAKIAEFYSHLPIKYKSHFENSALVIIDYDKAVRNGFIAYDKEVQISRIDYLENVMTNEQMAVNKEEISLKIKRVKEELEHLKSIKDDLGYEDEDEIDSEDW